MAAGSEFRLLLKPCVLVGYDTCLRQMVSSSLTAGRFVGTFYTTPVAFAATYDKVCDRAFFCLSPYIHQKDCPFLSRHFSLECPPLLHA